MAVNVLQAENDNEIERFIVYSSFILEIISKI